MDRGTPATYLSAAEGEIRLKDEDVLRIAQRLGWMSDITVAAVWPGSPAAQRSGVSLQLIAAWHGSMSSR